MTQTDDNMNDLLWLLLKVVICSIITWLAFNIYQNYLKTTSPEEKLKKNNAPTKPIINIWANGVHYPCSQWAEKGMRPYMEDRHRMSAGKAAADSSIYCIFDGHGGSEVAQFCYERMIANLIADSSYSSSTADAICRAFLQTDSQFSKLNSSLNCGSTSLVSVIHNKTIYVGNAGDCRAVLISENGLATDLSIDDKPNDEGELKRIEAAGGKVLHWGRWRVEGVLAVSRSIGDISLKPFVIPDARVQTHEIVKGDCFLLMASDGIWDVLTSSQAAKLVIQETDFENCARRICLEAARAGTSDNMTVLVIDLRKALQEESKTG